MSLTLQIKGALIGFLIGVALFVFYDVFNPVGPVHQDEACAIAATFGALVGFGLGWLAAYRSRSATENETGQNPSRR